MKTLEQLLREEGAMAWTVMKVTERKGRDSVTPLLK